MAERTFISFDWAIKKILRHKENFSVLEGFLSELLGFDIEIQNLLESESNKEHEEDKFDRVDILVKSRKGELMLIEVQAKGMIAAKEVLRYENMKKEDQVSYKRHIENRRIEMGVTETAIDKGIRRNRIDVAKEALKEGVNIELIAKITKLMISEIEQLQRGEELDKEDNEDE